MGSAEVAQAGTAELILDGQPTGLQVATLPALVLLKLIAHDDRPEQRGKHAEDIGYTLEHYWDLQPHIFYDVHHDVLKEIDSGRTPIAARVIGREIRTIMQLSGKPEDRIRAIIAKHLTAGVESAFIRRMALQMDSMPADALPLLQQLQRGFDEAAPAMPD